MKKVLSLVLVLALVLGSFSFAFAFEDVAGLDCEEEVETLAALGIIDGFGDGTFRPEETVTRAQMAKMLIAASGYLDLVTGAESSFNDCAGHWADSNVAFAAGQGMVNGYPDGSFKPDAQVSYDEAITMIVRALGYTDDSLTGTWPTNYKIKALDLGITEGVNIKAGGADRGGVAMLIFNALEAYIVDVNADDEAVKSTTMLLDRVGVEKTGQFISFIDVYDEDDALDTAIDLEPYLYQVVDYYENADEEVAYISDVDTLTLEGDATLVAPGVLSVEDADDDKFSVTVGAQLCFNWAEATTAATFDGADVKVIYDDIDEDEEVSVGDVIKGVIGTSVVSTVLVDADYEEDDVEVDANTDVKLPLDSDGDLDLTQLVVKGAVTAVADIEENDVVEVYSVEGYDETDGDLLTLNVVRDTVEGVISSANDTDETIVIDGTELEFAATPAILSSTELGDTYTVFLDSDGDIAFAEEVESAALSDYAIVVDVAEGMTDDTWGDTDVDDAPQIKLFTMSGDVTVYDIDTDDLDFTGDDTDLVGDLLLTYTAATDKIVPTGLAAKTLVLYEVDSDGVLTDITAYDTASTDIDGYTTSDNYSDPILNGSYLVDSDTFVFDATDADEDEWTVGGEELIGDKFDAQYTTEDGDDVVVAVMLKNNDNTETGTYAIFTEFNFILDANDDNIQEVIGFVDGEAAEYNTEDNTDDTVATADLNKLIDITLDGGKLTDVTGVAIGIAQTTVQAINGEFVKVDGSYEEVSTEAVVYLFEYDDDNELTVSVGSYDDVEEDALVEMYEVDDDADGYDIIIVVPEDSIENMI